MNVKNFIVAGLVGGIVNFLLGWLFYGILFKKYFPSGEQENMLFIALGCFTFGFFVSYIFVRWAAITIWSTGFKAGAVIGFFTSLFMNFFANSMSNTPDYKIMALDVAILTIISGLVGIAVALSNGKK
ncbi:MAG TPA: hypothetical protein VF677_04705 [Flavobacterium sp.]|jgi:hypothetical protein